MSGLVKANAIPTEPSVLAIATLDSPPTYIDIANIGDITGSSSRTVVDVSAHGTPARRKVGTLYDGGEWATTLWFIPGVDIVPTHTGAANGVRSIYKRNDLRAYAIFYRDEEGSAKFFNAYITKFSEKLPVAGVLSADVTFTIDGEDLDGTEAGGPENAVFAPAEE